MAEKGQGRARGGPAWSLPAEGRTRTPQVTRAKEEKEGAESWNICTDECGCGGI